MANEIRKDYLLNRWVILATERVKRPSDLRNVQSDETFDVKNCFFCPGNEEMTPPSFLMYTSSEKGIKECSDSGKRRVRNWLIRCIPNLYPAVKPTGMMRLKAGKLHQRKDALGAHEVIIESPNHYEHPHNATIDQLELLVNAYIDRLQSLSHWGYVSIFRNHKKEGGASLSHAHSQIIATSIIPKLILEEVNASKEYFQRTSTCPYCEILSVERKSSRFIYENNSFIAFAPWASIFPFEFWIIPIRHQQTLLQLCDERKDLAVALKTCFKGLAKTLRDPPYNYGFHIAPPKMKSKHYHWHLEVYPVLAVHAGFEKNFNMYINVIPPEVAAQSMRESIEE